MEARFLSGKNAFNPIIFLFHISFKIIFNINLNIIKRYSLVEYRIFYKDSMFFLHSKLTMLQKYMLYHVDIW